MAAPRDTEVTQTAAPASRCTSRPSPRACTGPRQRLPPAMRHLDSAGMTMSWAVTCTRQRPSRASRSRVSAGGGGRTPMPRSGTSARCMQHRARVARGAQASHRAHAARAHDPGNRPACRHADIIRSPRRRQKECSERGSTVTTAPVNEQIFGDLSACLRLMPITQRIARPSAGTSVPACCGPYQQRRAVKAPGAVPDRAGAGGGRRPR